MPSAPMRHAKIAFIGSHGIRKTTALYALAVALKRRGLNIELVKEVVRYNPLGFNEGATGEAQLWVIMSQVKAELELLGHGDVLVCDRAVVDNYAYALRAMSGSDVFDLEGFVANWTQTYDLFIRLLPDVPLVADGVRSTNDAFREEVEAILNDIVPRYVSPERLLVLPASTVTDRFDWAPLAARVGALLAPPEAAEPIAD